MSFWKTLFGKRSDSGGRPDMAASSSLETSIERPREQVWEYFLRTSEWQTWWGGGVSLADWREGGKLGWAGGGGYANHSLHSAAARKDRGHIHG